MLNPRTLCIIVSENKTFALLLYLALSGPYQIGHDITNAHILLEKILMFNQLLYKYRSLENFKNFVDIILKNRLYAATYKDLNDPMEGKYYYKEGRLDRYGRKKEV
mgnify:FL=1